MLKKVKIPRVYNYQARAKEILALVKTCKEGEGVQVPLEDVPKKEILQAALSRESKRAGIRINTMTTEGGLVISPAV